ncbi:hypothetical protein WLW48_22665, partial [Bordetella bronchiseptica]
MSAMVQLGPLMLPTALLLMLACVAAGSLAARWQAGSAGAGEMPLMRVLLGHQRAADAVDAGDEIEQGAKERR